MYFKDFPKIYYDFNTGANENLLKIVKDITFNVRFKKEIIENVSLYDEYDIVDGETPEIIAEKIYGSPNYHWIIMIANQAYDYIQDFPKPINILEAYITQKYGAGNEYAIHHYEKNGFIVDSTTVGASTVSNYDYETRENERKRRIKIISPQLISEILNQFKNLTRR